MDWIGRNGGVIADHAVAHLWLAVPPILLSFVLSIPLGWLANRLRRVRGGVLAAAGLLYAIPSLPLFIVLPILLGTGLRDPLNIVIALTLYGVALMVRSAADGLDNVDEHIRQSAVAMGYSGWGRFWAVDLPLAGPVLLAGLRVVSVSTVSLVTVGAVLGVDNLGMLFIDGFQRGISAEILTGIVATVGLALALDGLLVVVGWLLLPWTRPGSNRGAAWLSTDAVEQKTAAT